MSRSRTTRQKSQDEKIRQALLRYQQRLLSLPKYPNRNVSRFEWGEEETHERIGEDGRHLFWDPEKKLWVPQDTGVLDVPDILGAIKCIRFWYLTSKGLRSVAYDHYWTPGKQVAECKRTSYGTGCRNSDVPGLDCSCGIWLLNPDNEIVYNRMRDYVRPDDRLIAGYVMGVGNAIQGTDGWRVSHAHIDSLIAPPKYPNYYARPWEVSRMAKAYGVPVVADPILNAKEVWEIPDEEESVPGILERWLSRPIVDDATIIKKWLGL